MRAVLFLLLTACGATPAYRPEVLAAARARHGHELLASIRRTGCLGTCPGYELRVYRDGTVEYDGEYNVQVIGHATGHLSDAELKALDDLFLDNHYLGFDSSYETRDSTDMETVYTAYSPGQGVKTVAHYYGDEHGPLILFMIEKNLDRMAHAEQWIGRVGGPAASFHR